MGMKLPYFLVFHPPPVSLWKIAARDCVHGRLCGLNVVVRGPFMMVLAVGAFETGPICLNGVRVKTTTLPLVAFARAVNRCGRRT